MLMSVGHFHADRMPEAEAKALLTQAYRNKQFWNRMKADSFRVDRDFDIPYLAGYSKSGRIIYIDRHVPMSLVVGGKRLNIMPFLIIHERTEKALIDFMGMYYPIAHQIATFAEHYEIKKMRVSPRNYEKALDPYIKADAHEKITKVPADLDLHPYRDSKDFKLIQRMQAKMEGSHAN